MVHRPVVDGEDFRVGAIRFTTLDTPGHTPEHVSYAVADIDRAEEPFLVLTGGSLLVGAVGRTDLLGREHAYPYAAAMHRSLHEVLLPHEDSVMVYPTHGAGSLCSTGIASTPWSTIGYERRHDPLLAPMDIDAFARALLSGQPTIPRYFARMRPMNQAGPPLLGGVVPGIPPMSGTEVRSAAAADALVVDARRSTGALERVAGALSIPAGSSFGTWLGWVIDADRPVILLIDDPADLDDLARQALRIGFDRILGYLDGGLAAWQSAGGEVEVDRPLGIDALAARLEADPADRPLVIDVRQASEFESGHVPGSIHIGAGELGDRLDQLPAGRPIATICASGYRSAVATSMLRAAGFTDVTSVAAGVPEWAASGRTLAYGAPDR